ncbi:MAG: glutamate racemase [Hyphomicrobiaceae bacterium]
MIGVFDSGAGGLTVLKALAARFEDQRFLYLGDHANVPYGNRETAEIVDLTRAAVEALFRAGCKLVILGCNTATAVAARELQQVWLPASGWRAQGHNLLGIIAPTVEAATQTPWAVTTPQYPQKHTDDVVVVFGTHRTITSGVYAEEIGKRCPRVTVVEIACPGLAGAIEARAPDRALDEIICQSVGEAQRAVASRLGEGRLPDRAILGCTHFPIVEQQFRAALPAATRLLSQPQAIADSLEDYLARHPHYGRSLPGDCGSGRVRLVTTGDPATADALATVFWSDAPAFEPTSALAVDALGNVAVA